jgi:hypothetical protein
MSNKKTETYAEGWSQTDLAPGAIVVANSKQVSDY